MTTPTPPAVCISTFYHFAALNDCAALQPAWKALMQAHDVRGTILVTPEGVNATIAGPEAGVERVLAHLRADARLAGLTDKRSAAAVNPFTRAKVKLKKETIPLGVTVDPTNPGTYVKARDWNALIADPRTIVVDTRNDYEVGIGRFAGALDPRTRTFKDLPAWLATHLPEDKSVPVAMYCTGGIRCEKSTAYLKQQGYAQVYHLEGGILKYLEEVPETESLWQGDCYVFDDRVAVRHDLRPADGYTVCKGCNQPVAAGEFKRQYQGRQVCPTCAALNGEQSMTVRVAGDDAANKQAE